MTSTSSASASQTASNHDELFMQQSLLFSDTLKDMKNLRKQLYSAAEFFENSYSKQQDHDQIVVETLKDYAIKALINTVDHLGSVAFKVNNLLDDKIEQVSHTQLRFTCLEQRVKSCQEFINQGGLSHRSLMIKTPKHQRRYIFPDGYTSTTNLSVEVEEDDSHQYITATQVTSKESPSFYLREMQSTFKSPTPTWRQGSNFSFTANTHNRKPERRVASPLHFPLIRSGSLLKRSPSPNYSNAKRRYPSEPRRSVSLSTFVDKNRATDMEQYSGKSKRLFKALLSLRKPRKESTLYKLLDEN